jgi:ribosome recycling factor
MYDFKGLTSELVAVQEHYKVELSSVRTGRAVPALLDGVKVDAYGTPMPLNQVGSVTIEDARTLRISPWDHGLAKAIEKAIGDANLGVAVGADDRGVRVSFPELTSERREQLIKLTRSKLEEARTSARRARDDTWQDIQKQEKDKLMSEDDKFRAKEQMEKMIQETNRSLDDIAKRKEAELRA